jgi:hypothetical protein
LFSVLIVWLYIANAILKKFFVNKDTTSNLIDKKLTVLKNIKVKDIEQQKQYIELMDRKNSLYGNQVMKFVFIILMFIVFNICIMYIPRNFLPLFALIYSFLIPLAYIFIVKDKKYSIYNYLSMTILFIFFTGYIVIQVMNSLMIYGIKVKILYLLPLLFIINVVVKLIKEKIFKRRDTSIQRRKRYAGGNP